jgi:hypothetical protein
VGTTNPLSPINTLHVSSDIVLMSLAANASSSFSISASKGKQSFASAIQEGAKMPLAELDKFGTSPRSQGSVEDVLVLPSYTDCKPCSVARELDEPPVKGLWYEIFVTNAEGAADIVGGVVALRALAIAGSYAGFAVAPYNACCALSNNLVITGCKMYVSL